MNIERIMNRYGRSVSAFDSDGNLIEKKKCFIQALRYKNKMYLEGTPTETGMDDAGYYLFLGPASMQTDRIFQTVKRNIILTAVKKSGTEKMFSISGLS